MSASVRKNGIFFLIGLAVIIVAVLGYMTFSRMRSAQTDTSEKSEVSFQVNQPTPSATVSDAPTCTSLQATPATGKSPLNVSLSGNARGTQGSNLIMTFAFGDGEEEIVERLATNPDGAETQMVAHTYTEPGSYQAILIVENEIGEYVNTCEAIITVEGTRAQGSTGQTSGTPAPTTRIQPTATKVPPTSAIQPTRSTTAPTAAPTTKPSPTIKPSPTTRPTSASNPTPTIIDDESVAMPNVPKAGGFPLTAVAGMGGIAIVLLALLL
jgi:PKD repeat protein